MYAIILNIPIPHFVEFFFFYLPIFIGFFKSALSPVIPDNSFKNFIYTAEGSSKGLDGVSDEHGILDGEYLYLTDESFIFHPSVENPKPGQQYTFQSMLNGTDFYNGNNPYISHVEKMELFDCNMLISGIPVGEYMLELETESEIPDIIAVKIYDPNN